MEKKEMTEADKIWDSIKNLPINMYALPNQTVKDHVSRIKIHDNEVHLKLASQSVLPSLEELLSKKFAFEEVAGVSGLAVVRALPKPLVLPKPEPKE